MLENRTTTPRFNYGDSRLWNGDERWELVTVPRLEGDWQRVFDR